MYGMLHAGLIPEIQDRRQRQAAQSRAAAVAREVRAVERAKRKLERARRRADRAQADVDIRDQRVIDLRDDQDVQAKAPSQLPW
jgi:hypothetical protein